MELQVEVETDLFNSAICRLCAENNTNGILLFEESSPNGDLRSFINMYLPFKVQNDGKLPQTICPGCNIQLQATVQFFDLVIEGQKKIRQMWKDQVVRKKTINRGVTSSSQHTLDKIDSGLECSFNNVSEPSHSQGEGDALTRGCDDDRLIEGLMSVETQLDLEVFNGKGPLFAAEDPLVLKGEGLEKPRKKRGRPKKIIPIETELIIDNTSKENKENKHEKGLHFDMFDKEEDPDGRRRRKRKVPQRYKEAVQGKELDRIFREEGVLDEEEDKEVMLQPETIYIEEQPAATSVEQVAEVIGHLETQEGQDLGEVVIANKSKPRRKYPIRKKGRFQCEICLKRFLHHGRYIIHKSLHKGVRFECMECEKRFSTKENFELHQKISNHSGEGIIESLEDDFDEVDLPSTLKEQVVCKYCSKMCNTRQDLDEHLAAEHKDELFRCQMCQKSFPTQVALKSHAQIHEESGKEKGYPCNLCGKKLNHPSSVLYHREAEHNNGRRFVCNKCGKCFKHKQLLQRHQLVHSDNRPFACTMCTASFKTKANLMNHHATHTGEKKYRCEHCNQQFAHKTSLTLHYRWHSGQKPYQCNVCKKMFSQKGNLQEHQRIHTGEKPFSCTLCSRKFTTSSQYKLHVKRHTGERPWKCEFCGKSFLHKDAWKCHIRRHKGEKPFQCPHCSRDFPEQWALKKHMRLHTGERPYSCTTCGKTFADCSNLTKHKKVHAKEGKTTDPPKVDGVGLSVWNIIQSHLEDNTVITKDAIKQDDDVQQIIYVTYQQDEEKLKDSNEKFIIPNLVEEVDASETVALPGETLQVTDDQGNPIHFTMQDGSSLQITTTDGQLHVTTNDGQIIPVQITTSDGQPIATELAMPVVDESMPGLEFSTTEGQKFKIITPYTADQIPTEYLNNIP